MDVDTQQTDWDAVDWDIPSDDGDGGAEPPESGYGPGRGPQRRHYPPEQAGHGLTAVICLVAIAFGGVFLLTMTLSRSGGGIGMAYVLSFVIAAMFMGTFYAGGLWLGAKRGVLEASLNRRARRVAPDGPASTSPDR